MNPLARTVNREDDNVRYHTRLRKKDIYEPILTLLTFPAEKLDSTVGIPFDLGEVMGLRN